MFFLKIREIYKTQYQCHWVFFSPREFFNHFTYFYPSKTSNMSLLNQNSKKDKKKGDKKGKSQSGQGSKHTQKPSTGFISKQQNTGSQRGS
jgi:hypothetical protein